MTPRHRRRGAPLLLAALWILGGPPAPAGAGCPADNLLAGRLPLGAPAALGRITDERVTPEGARWNAPPAFVLAPATESLTWDLGSVVELRALLLQADGNDVYPVASSLDGVGFEPLVEVSPAAEAVGLRTRAVRLANRPARFLRLTTPAGDGAHSVAELAAWCAVPAPWPPAFTVVDAPLDAALGPARLAWNDVTSRWWELALALAGGALLAWGAWRGAAGRRFDRLLALGGVLAALTYFNFGAFHFFNYVHAWDTFHYYVGAKYFRELGYERLYECVAVADAAEPELAARVAKRRITDLRTNVLESSAAILAAPGRCTEHFSPARWKGFRNDVAWFRARETAERWEELSTDHGYNATPVWNVAGSLLANLGPASDGLVLALTALDVVYFGAMLAVAAWAFGWRPVAAALLVFATFFPCRFFWTGGAFLRWDWLFYTVAAVACLKRGRPWLGGLALGYAALLRIFPGLLAAGPALALAIAVARALRRHAGESRRDALALALRAEPARSHLRFLAGAALAAALLLPLGAVVAGGPEAYRGFVANTLKHKSTPLTNNMGLRTVLTFRPAEVGRRLVSDAEADPWLRWKTARLAAWQRSKPLAAAILAGVLALLGLAVARHPEPWIAAALGTVTIAFAVELTSYYYAFLFVPALLWARWRWTGPLLLVLCAFSQFVSLAPLPGMSTWRDEQYTWISLATVLALTVLLARFVLVPAAPPRRASD